MGAKLKKIIFLAAAIVMTVTLTGCGARLTVYDYASGGIRFSLYTLEIDADTVEAMERTAATKPDGGRYTVEDYFYGLFTLLGCELMYAERTDGGYAVQYRKAHIGGMDIDTVPAFTSDYSENGFVRTYTAVAPDPFNGLREKYDNAPPGSSSNVIEILKNGYTVRNEYGEAMVVYPSVRDAFPYAASVGEDGLQLDYVWAGSARMDSTGVKNELGDNRAEYVFSRYFDDSERSIGLKYRVAVPYGWYMMAILAGLITLTVFSLVTRTKKQKSTLLDRFPYDPEEYRSYDDHLPTVMK